MIQKSRESWLAMFVCFMFVVAGCGGRAANPVLVSQYGDQRKSWKAGMFVVKIPSFNLFYSPYNICQKRNWILLNPGLLNQWNRKL